MSESRSGSGTAVSRSRAAVALACLLLPACAPAARTGEARVPAGAAADWLNRAYLVTCDVFVPDGSRATVVDGSARVPADGSCPPHYEHYDIRVTATAGGDVDGDGAPDAVVLLDCSPQPSNGVVQEVQLFSSTGRRRSPAGRPPQPAHEGVQPHPVHDPAGLSVEDGQFVAAMTAYGPDDSHASGPSVPITVRWRSDGQQLVRAAP
jgi:hypothetical protein